MKSIEIFNQKVKIGNDKYNFIVKELWHEGWGKTHSIGRVKPKTYQIKKNNKTILSTSLHQTYYARKRKLLGGDSACYTI